VPGQVTHELAAVDPGSVEACCTVRCPPRSDNHRAAGPLPSMSEASSSALPSDDVCRSRRTSQAGSRTVPRRSAADSVDVTLLVEVPGHGTVSGRRSPSLAGAQPTTLSARLVSDSAVARLTVLIVITMRRFVNSGMSSAACWILSSHRDFAGHEASSRRVLAGGAQAGKRQRGLAATRRCSRAPSVSRARDGTRVLHAVGDRSLGSRTAGAVQQSAPRSVTET
jgi:hypothetical protein